MVRVDSALLVGVIQGQYVTSMIALPQVTRLTNLYQICANSAEKNRAALFFRRCRPELTLRRIV